MLTLKKLLSIPKTMIFKKSLQIPKTMKVLGFWSDIYSQITCQNQVADYA